MLAKTEHSDIFYLYDHDFEYFICINKHFHRVFMTKINKIHNKKQLRLFCGKGKCLKLQLRPFVIMLLQSYIVKENQYFKI